MKVFTKEGSSRKWNYEQNFPPEGNEFETFAASMN